MNFTYPAFLFALSAIAIPVIIHLFNFRKFRVVYFSNVRFLKEVQQETQSRSRLKHLLVLAARILALIFLVLAFSQPYIPVKNSPVRKGDRAISVFIDNSFSMEAVNKNGTLLDDARKKAKEIAAAYKPSDRFQLFTNDFEGRHQRFLSKEEFLDQLEEIRISPATRKLSEETTRAFDLLSGSGMPNRTLFVLSDFQKTTMDADHVKNDTSVQVRLLPIESPDQNNVYIDTCWFETPVRQSGQLEKLHVRIRNLSGKDLEDNSIRLFINDVQKTPASFSALNHSETEVILSFSIRQAGIQQCRIELNDYPITFDDKFYFSFNIAGNIPVISVNATEAGSPYINKLFGSDSLFSLKNMSASQIDYSLLAGSNMIILDELATIPSGLAQELSKYVSNGGTLLVLPSGESDAESYNTFLSQLHVSTLEKLDTADTKVEKINLAHPVYKDVFEKKTFSEANLDLPKVSAHFRLSRTSRSTEEDLLTLQNGDPFLAGYSSEKGSVYLCASPLGSDYSSFARHAVFVPTLIRIAIESQHSTPLFYTIGNEQPVFIPAALKGEELFHITGAAAKTDIIPEQRSLETGTELYIHGQIKDAGNYDVLAGKQRIAGISFNDDRRESDPAVYSNEDLEKVIDQQRFSNFKIMKGTEHDISAELREMEEGKKLWKLCLWLVLAFLTAEALLLRFMK